MKVVHITPYYPPSIGGIARFVSGIVENTSNSADVQVITQEGKDSENTTVLSVGKGRFILKAFNLLKKLEPDVVHCHSHWHMLAPAVAYKRFNRDVRILFTFHTEPVEQKKGIKSRLFGRLLSNCDVVTFVSKALKEAIGNQIEIRTRQEVVYPGVGGKEVSQEEVADFAKTHGSVGRSPVLVYIGLLEWKKKVEGVKILLSAMDSLRKEFPLLILLIVGDGSRRGEVEEVISTLSLSDNVAITGLVDNVLIPLSLCDLYVHISLQEGLGQSLLEAMSLGKPIVASNIGGIPEIILSGETGILVEPNLEAVMSGIVGMLKDETSAARVGEKAKRFAVSNFSWDKISDDFMRLYSSS